MSRVRVPGRPSLISKKVRLEVKTAPVLLLLILPLASKTCVANTCPTVMSICDREV